MKNFRAFLAVIFIMSVIFLGCGMGDDEGGTQSDSAMTGKGDSPKPDCPLTGIVCVPDCPDSGRYHGAPCHKGHFNEETCECEAIETCSRDIDCSSRTDVCNSEGFCEPSDTVCENDGSELIHGICLYPGGECTEDEECDEQWISDVSGADCLNGTCYYSCPTTGIKCGLCDEDEENCQPGVYNFDTCDCVDKCKKDEDCGSIGQCEDGHCESIE